MYDARCRVENVGFGCLVPRVHSVGLRAAKLGRTSSSSPLLSSLELSDTKVYEPWLGCSVGEGRGGVGVQC